MANTTKIHLAQAAHQLLETKPLSKIKVSDITDLCGVNRMTFYYHFSDIYQLLEWALQHAVDKFRKNVLNDKDTAEESLIKTFHLISNEHNSIMNIYHSISLEQLEYFLSSLTRSYVDRMVTESVGNHVIDEADRNFIVDFYNYAFIGILVKWFKHDMADDPEFIVKKLHIMFEGVVELSIANMSE